MARSFGRVSLVSIAIAARRHLKLVRRELGALDGVLQAGLAGPGVRLPGVDQHGAQALAVAR
jgi:hypothetical protein